MKGAQIILSNELTAGHTVVLVLAPRPGQATSGALQIVCSERYGKLAVLVFQLRRVFRLWIGIGSLWNLDGSRRRSPTGRGPRAVSGEVPLIRVVKIADSHAQ
jgi:hypothetical protein